MKLRFVQICLIISALFFVPRFGHAAFSCLQLFQSDENPASAISPDLRKIIDYLQSKTSQDGTLMTTAEELYFKRGRSSEMLLNNTVEIIYYDTSPFGHVLLRVGKKLISFNTPGDTTFKDYYRTWRQDMVKPGQISVIIPIASEKISSAMTAIQRFVQSSKEFNLPPMDAYSSKIALENSGGKWSLQAPIQGRFSAANWFKGKVQINDDAPYIQSPNGVKIPIEQNEDGKLTIQSYSCSTSVDFILKTFFGIVLKNSYRATSVQQEILSGSLGPVLNYESSSP
jgi:hypothetical protein